MIGQQPDVLREHAEHQLVDEMRDAVGFVAPFAQPLRQTREFGGGFLGQLLPGLFRLELFRIEEGLLEPVALRAVEQVVEREVVHFLHGVGPVGVDPDQAHVGRDQKRRVFERDRILLELGEGLLQVGVAALVFPREAALAPDVGPSFAAARLARALLEREPVALGIGGDGIEDSEEGAEVIEMTLGCRALLKLDAAPLRHELMRRHD